MLRMQFGTELKCNSKVYKKIPKKEERMESEKIEGRKCKKRIK